MWRPDGEPMKAVLSGLCRPVEGQAGRKRMSKVIATRPGQSYKPKLRPMISFMISVVPPKMDCTRLSAQARATGYSRM